MDNEINNFFKLLIENIDSKEPFNDKRKCISTYQIITKQIASLNSEPDEIKTEKINSYVLKVKNCIKIYHFNVSSNIINSENTLEKFLEYFCKIKSEVSVIDLVFKSIFSYDSHESNKIKNIFYKSILENIILANDNSFYILLFQLINKIRCHLSKSTTFKKILEYQNNQKAPLIENLLNQDLQNVMNTIHEVISIFTDIDTITNSLGNCIQNFNNLYIVMIGNIYNVHANTINSIDDKDRKKKFYEIVLIMNTETLLHESIFNDPEIYKNILNNEILKLNTDFIVSVFNEKVNGIIEHYDKIIGDVLNNTLNVQDLFSKLFDFNFTGFLDIYFKLYKYSIISIEKICESITDKVMQSVSEREPDLLLLFLSYKFLISLQDELMFNFTPNIDVNQAEDNPSESIYVKLNDLFNEKIRQIPPEKIADFIMTFSQSKISEKATKDFSDISNSLIKINNSFDPEQIYEICRYILYNIKNKDEFEELFSQNLCKKIITGTITRYNLPILDSYIHEVSKLDNLCLHVNRKILSSYNEGKYISNEFNILFEGSLFKKNDNFIDLKLIPEGISPLKQFVYSEKDFKSETFKTFLNDKKQHFASYFKSKYEERKLYWGENMSTFDLEYTIGTILVNFRVNYKQTDTMFLIQNEYYNLFYKLKKENAINFIDENNELLQEFTELDNYLKSNEFVKFMLQKKIMILENNQINHLVNIKLVVFNHKNNIRKNKKFDFYKLKFKNEKKAEIIPVKKEKTDDIVFFRSDYVQAAIVRICKRQKDLYILEDDLYDKVDNLVKKRFEFERPLFAKSLEKLVNQDYIEKKESNDRVEFKYIP
tara:strand:+ start:71 stop:2548 length:2478 start_codon:yes stop_codon:yes gene_type:complete